MKRKKIGISPTAGILLGWGLFVICGVWVTQTGFSLWTQQSGRWKSSRQRLGRLKGWVEAEKELRARQEEVLGPFAKGTGLDIGWISLQGLQQVAKEEGVTVAEVRPSHLIAQGTQPRLIRLDARLLGGFQQIGTLLQRLPDLMPGARLENLQFIPQQEENRVQVLLQVTLPELRVSS